MSAKTNGGPAFPAQPIYQHPHGATSMSSQEGMTLRDWFAGQAAATILGGITASGASTDASAAIDIAKASYILADTMLAERSK